MRSVHTLIRLGLVLFLAGRLGAAAVADAAKRGSEAPIVTAARLAALEAETGERSADTLLELGLAYDERHHPGEAAGYYQRAAAQGAGTAELRLGALYETGEGVAQSYAEARAHYQRAVNLGVAEANLRLGLLHLEGWGVPADPAAAVAHIERAAAADYVPAQQILSTMYFVGLKVPRNLPKALALVERAAARRDPSALVAVGQIKQAAVRMPQDLQLAREWYQLSAEQDYTRGMVAMASTFLRPGATPEDVKLGLRWLELAADGGNGAAAFYLAGTWLLTPIPVAGDRIAAAETRLRQSAEAGELQAQEVLELAKGGQPLALAFHFVMTVPFEERHVQRLAADPRFAENAAGDQLPRPVKIVAPIYPVVLRLERVPGEAVVEFTIDTTGRARDPKVVRATHPAFGESALASILATRFQPAKKHGSFVNVRVQQPVIFQPTDITSPDSAAQDRAAGLR